MGQRDRAIPHAGDEASISADEAHGRHHKAQRSGAPACGYHLWRQSLPGLSVAGMRAGLNGERSGLFMEQIRIIREMRNADILRGRTGVSVRPRYGIWENVVGALSSGRDPVTGKKRPGADFQKVLEAFLQIEEPHLHVVRPETGRWEYAGAVLGVRSSVAWVTWDAQHFGVPQRRRRIFLVADFAGCSAIPILFVPDSVPGHPAPRTLPRQAAAGITGNGFTDAGRVRSASADIRGDQSLSYQSEK